MKKDTRPWSAMHGMLATMLFVLVLGMSVSLNVLARSSTVSIQIHQQPPFFSPHSITAEAGSVIQWENRGRELHSILADDCLRRSNCAFESRMLEPGEHFLLQNLQPGNYAYHCGIHPFMRGFIQVKEKSWGASSSSI